MTNYIRKSSAVVLAGILIAFTPYVDSAFARGGGGGGGKQGPPPEAYTACEDKSEGDTASFESPRGDMVTGVCVQDRDGDRLVLEPDNPPVRGGGGRDRDN